MLRCECRARLGRGWQFCEACGRPVTVAEAQARPEPAHSERPAAGLGLRAVTVGVTSSGVTFDDDPAPSGALMALSGTPAANPEPGTATMADTVSAPTTAQVLHAPALLIGRFNWRFLLAPVAVGTVLGLCLAWLSLWTVMGGMALGAAWGLRRYLAISKALSDFEHEWVFDKVLAYGACALGARAWWPSGILYLTDQTLKFRPFNHTNEREVSLDPCRLMGFDFPQAASWPADWRALLVTSTYGPVFGTMKVFDRVVWEQTLKEAKFRALSGQSTELS